MRNPKAQAIKAMGITQADFNAARAALVAFLVAHDNEEDVDETAARASLPAAVTDRVWNHLRRDVGVVP